MSERGQLERSIRIAGDSLALVLLAIGVWYYIDPDAEPKQLVLAAKDWVAERLERSESFNRTLRSIRNLPEREKP